MPTNKTIKTVSKKAGPKSVVKKVIVKTPKLKKAKVAKDIKQLVRTSTEYSFWMTDGQILNSLLELEGALGTMSMDVFSHHVTDDKNDFADWVEYVLDDHGCAAGLRAAMTTKKAQLAVKKALKGYTY